MAELENMKSISKSTWGGKRPGAGKPKGKKTKAVLDREAAAKAFKERVAIHANELFNAQKDLAVGEKYLMVIKTIGSGAKQRRETSIVTDPETIKQFLDEELEDTDTEYYFMTTKPANNMALDSLLNRSFGKAEEKVNLEHSGAIKTNEYDPKLASEYAEFMKGKTKKT